MSGEALVYEHFFAHSGEADAGLATALALEDAAGNKSIWTAFQPMQVSKVGILVTVAIEYDTLSAACVVAFFRRVLYGSDTGRVEMGRVTIPQGMKAGSIFEIDIPNGDGNDNGEVIAGGQVVSAIATQGAGGGSIAGDFQPFIAWQPRSEVHANNKDSAGVVTFVRDTTTVQV